MQTFTKDLALGVRQLVRRPGFAAAAIASLALGIGLNTTLFSVVNGVLFRPSPIAQPERLVQVYTGLSQEFPQLMTSWRDYLDLAEGLEAVESLAAHAYTRGVLSPTGGGEPVLVTGETVSANYFEVLGLRPTLGRGFRPDENRVPGASAVVVVSDGFWRRQFGGRADVIGETVRLSGHAYTIVGVAPRGFRGSVPGLAADFWTPLMMVDQLTFFGPQMQGDGDDPGATRLERRATRWLFVTGRLAPGRTVDEARAQAEAVYARLRAEHPVTNEDAAVSVVRAADVRFHPMLDGYVRAAGAALLAAVGLVLVVACANVANLLLARSAARRREFAVRAALGASRGRLIRQMLAEGFVLAAAGAAVGVTVAWWAVRGLAGVGTDVFPVPVTFDLSLDVTVLAFAAGVSVITALLCSLAPAWSASKRALVPALKNADAVVGRRWSMSHVLVVGQLTASVLLLVVGALLVRGLMAARDTSLGFDPRPISTLGFNLQMNGYDEARATAFRQRALEALAALPGVTGVTVATRLPLAPDINLDGLLVRGHHAPDADGTLTDVVSVGAGYFDVVGVPIVAGRAIDESDLASRRRVAVINETMARRYWPAGSAVGQQVYSGSFDAEPFEVIGVARDHKVRSVGEAPRDYMHVPYGPSRALGFLVRTTTASETALPMLRRALWAIEPDIRFTDDQPASAVVAATLAPTQIGALVLGAFGLLALLLAAVGLYGVIAYSVSRRTREVGIRLALGAPRGAVMRMVVWQGGRLAAAGIVLGLGLAALVGGLLESLLYGVSGLDPIAFAGAAAVLLMVALAANLMPALTASRVDPLVALRTE